MYAMYAAIIVIKFFTPAIDSATALQNVTLTSTSIHRVSPEQKIVFTCTTRYSDILQWSSIEYISSEGQTIEIRLNNTLMKGVSKGNACAQLTNFTVVDGVMTMESELYITVSSQYPTATVSCDNGGHGSKKSITFGMFQAPVTISVRMLKSISRGVSVFHPVGAGEASLTTGKSIKGGGIFTYMYEASQ